MADITKPGITEWVQVTENIENWDNQIKKLKEDLSEFSDGELKFNFTSSHKEEEVFNKI